MGLVKEMKTKHATLGKSEGKWIVNLYGDFTHISEAKTTKNEAIKFIKVSLSEMAQVQADKYTAMIKEFLVWDEEGNE